MTDKRATELFFISAVRASLNGLTVDSVPDGVSVTGVIDLAKRHSLFAAVFSAVQKCECFSRCDRFAVWQKEFFGEVMRDTLHRNEAKVIVTHLCRNGITLVPLKGMEIQKLYPSFVLRSMNDLDFLYRGADAGVLTARMKEIGYEAHEIGFFAHDTYIKPSCAFVEMHRILALESDEYASCLRHFFDNALPDETVEKLYHSRPEDLYLHLVVHACHHLSESGIGVRPLCDVYTVCRAFDKTWDKQYIHDSLAAVGLDKFSDRMREIAEKWFGNGMPDLDDETEAFFVTGGLFQGNMKESDWEFATSGHVSGFTFFLSKLFMPYEDMQGLYPVLRKVPALLPFVWIYRWFDILFTRLGRVKEVADSNRMDKDKKEYAARIMSGLGINT